MVGIFDTNIFDAGIFDYPKFLNEAGEFAVFLTIENPSINFELATPTVDLSVTAPSINLTTARPSVNLTLVLDYGD